MKTNKKRLFSESAYFYLLYVPGGLELIPSGELLPSREKQLHQPVL
jgi:hypothetical protein